MMVRLKTVSVPGRYQCNCDYKTHSKTLLLRHCANCEGFDKFQAWKKHVTSHSQISGNYEVRFSLSGQKFLLAIDFAFIRTGKNIRIVCTRIFANTKSVIKI